MSTVAYMCPCCGAPLEYAAASGKLECASCGNSYEMEVIESMNAEQKEGRVQFEIPKDTFDAEAAEQMQAYICQSCGAELMTEDTTTATECPYCGSPTILPERIEGGVKPEWVIPFTVTKEQAQEKFETYFKGKKLLPNIFLDSRNRISEMRKLYVPYWLFACDAEGQMLFDCQRRHTRREGDWEVERIEHYLVSRDGRMSFENIPVDGSEKMDNKITESLEPYDLSAAVEFQPAVLAGALADHADVNAENCEGRAVERVETSMAQALRDTVRGYTHVSERRRNIQAEGGKATPVLMPVWLITTEKEGKTYTFAINGQTGKLTCDVPADTKKSLLWGVGSFIAAFAVSVLILYLTEYMGSGTVLVAAVISLLIALGVLGGLKAQLKQAVFLSGASQYVKEDSFELLRTSDHYMYTTTNRRKIERNDRK